MKRFWTVVLATSMAVILLTGCGKEEEEVVKPMDEIYALVEAFDYEEYKASGFKVNKLGDYPLKLETKPE